MRKATQEEIQKHRAEPRIDFGFTPEFYFIPHKKGAAEVLAEICSDGEMASVIVMNNKKIYSDLSKIFDSKEEAINHIKSL